MIKETIPLSLPEVSKLIDKEEGKEIKTFIKKFNKIKYDEAIKLREEIEKLDLIKVKQEHIVKIIDFLPEDTVDLNKIFTDVSLDENEISSILEIVKKYI